AAKASAPDLPEAERRALLLRAAELYRGPLLPGYYEDWIPPEAARLDSTLLRVVARLVPLLLSAGQLEAALAHARRAVEADPLSEGAAQQLMQVLAASGAPYPIVHSSALPLFHSSSPAPPHPSQRLPAPTLPPFPTTPFFS